MAAYNFSQEGIRRLGDFIREQMEDCDITIDALIERCMQVGYQTNKGKIQRLRDGVGMEPSPGLLWAIARTGFITHRDGTPYTLEDFLKIACGQIDPAPTAAELAGNYEVSKHPFPAAVSELKRLIGDRSLEEAAKDWGLPPERLRELLESADPNRATPNMIEAHRIVSKAYPDKLVNRLFQLYTENKTNGKVNRKR